MLRFAWAAYAAIFLSSTLLAQSPIVLQGFPTWRTSDEYTKRATPSLPAAYQALDWDPTGYSGFFRIGGQHAHSGSLTAFAESGKIAMLRTSPGQTHLSIDTGYSSIFDIEKVDLSGIDPAFGNESVIFTGLRPDGRPQVSVITRNKEDDIATATQHDLPVIGNVGEVYCRVNSWDGLIVLFEAASRSFIAYADFDQDRIPETRLPSPIYSFPQDDLDFVFKIEPPLGSIPGMLLQYSRTRGRCRAVMDFAGVRTAGTVYLRPLTARRGWATFPCSGMQRVAINGVPGDVINILREQAGSALGFSPWIASVHFDTSLCYKLSPIAPAPLGPGDRLRMEMGGQVLWEGLIQSEASTVVWSWGIQGTNMSTILIQGENLDQVGQIFAEWRASDESHTPPHSLETLPIISQSATALLVGPVSPRSTPGNFWLRLDSGVGAVLVRSDAYFLPEITN